MELTEPIESINRQLIENFGIDTLTGAPIWRVVFSEDQFEKRLGTYEDITTNGLFIRRVTEVREVPKYKQWIHSKFVLERLVVVPEQNLEDLPTSKVSYEPLWVFENVKGEYLPPKWEACKFIIDTVYAAQYGPKNHSMKKYIDDEDSQDKSLALKAARVDGIMEALWGEQSGISDGIKAKETVVLSNRDFEVTKN